MYGNIATLAGSSCGSLIGVVLAPGATSAPCSFTGPFTGKAGASQTDRVDDPCARFSWNVQAERALFASAAAPVAGGRDARSGPVLAPDRLYDLSLRPQSQVRFVVPPGKKTPVADGYGAVARLHIATAGAYRISLNQPFWIDVLDDHKLIASTDFTGQHGCDAPHKIVQFSLPAGTKLLLQLSGAHGDHARIAITRAP